MVNKETRVHLHEKVDAAITQITRNHIREVTLGTLRLTIYERRRGSWRKIQTPHAEDPIRGKTHDIIYSYDPDTQETERIRFGKLAKNPEESMITRNPKREQQISDGIYYPGK